MGSITHITDGDEILNTYQYDAWGDVVSEREGVSNRFKFNGQQLDPITGQYYLRARYYNPVIGRFTQEDTYRGDGLNLYSYCKNNPVYYVDPTGHESSTVNSYQDARDGLLNNSEVEYPLKLDLQFFANNNLGQRLIPGTPGIVTGGNSTKLGKNIMESMELKRTTSWKGYQAQHIIPSEMKNHPVIEKIG